MFEEGASGSVEGRHEAMGADIVAWLFVFTFFFNFQL